MGVNISGFCLVLCLFRCQEWGSVWDERAAYGEACDWGFSSCHGKWISISSSFIWFFSYSFCIYFASKQKKKSYSNNMNIYGSLLLVSPRNGCF